MRCWLPLFIASVLGVAAYLAVTRPKDLDIWEDIEKDWY